MNRDELLMQTVAVEQGLVGTVLAGASLHGVSWVGEALATGLRAPDFLLLDYRRAWRAIQFVHDSGERPSLVQVSLCLGEAGDFRPSWDEVELARLMPLFSTPYLAEDYARAVHRYAVERREREQILSSATTALGTVGEKPRRIQRAVKGEMPT